MQNHSLAHNKLLCLYVAMGAYALIAQTALLRQFMVVFHGNELSLGLLLGLWFLGIGLGAEVSGRLTGRLSAHRWPVPLIFLAGAALPLAALLAMKTAPTLWKLTPGIVPGWRRIFVAGLLATPVGAWVGVAFPFFAGFAAGPPISVGRLFVWEAVGSMAAGVLFTFVLAPYVSPFGCMLVAAAVLLLAVAVWTTVRPARALAVLSGLLCLFLIFSGAAGRAEQALEKIRFQALGTGGDFEQSIQTHYQNVTFARSGEQVQIYGNGGYLDSFPDPYVHRQEAALLLAQPADPRRVLLLGGGVTGLAGAMLACPHVRKLDIVDLDDMLVSNLLARLPDAERELLRRDPRVRIILGDVRRFSRQTEATYDLVVVVAPDPSTALLNRLYTVEFFREVRRLLAPAGVIALSVTGAANLIGAEIGPYLASIHRTLGQVFSQVLILPGDQVHLFAGGANADLRADPDVMKARYLSLYRQNPPMPAEVIDLFVVPERIEKMQTALSAESARVNLDLHPVSYLAFLRVWDQFAGGGLARALRALVELPFVFWVILLVAACLAALAAPALVSPPRRLGVYGLVSLGSSGLAGMTVFILASIAYQSLFGQMYQKVALVVAAYMTGLALGGRWAADRGEHTGSRLASLLLTGDALLLLGGVMFWLYLQLIQGYAGWFAQLLLVLLVAFAGLGAGVAFPAAAFALAAEGMALGRRAGRVDAVDHLSALVGALLVGVVLLPVLGLPAVCLMVVCLKTASIGAGLLAGRGKHGKI